MLYFEIIRKAQVGTSEFLSRSVIIAVLITLFFIGMSFGTS